MGSNNIKKLYWQTGAVHYKSFIRNSLFYKTMRELKEDKKFCWLRYLNPNNSKSASTCFYSLEILDEFDKYYKENS